MAAEPSTFTRVAAPAAMARAVVHAEPTPFQRQPQTPISRHQLTDLDIPTFIRRQMD
jgi:hypothetical protein